MIKEQVCCVCGQSLEQSDYLMIDGLRRWCVPCGNLALGRLPFPFEQARRRKGEHAQCSVPNRTA